MSGTTRTWHARLLLSCMSFIILISTPAWSTTTRTIYVVNNSRIGVSYPLRAWNSSPNIHFVQTTSCGTRKYCVNVVNARLTLPTAGYTTLSVSGGLYRYTVRFTNVVELNKYQKYNIACHEFGHVVNLSHNGHGCMALPVSGTYYMSPGTYNLSHAS